MKRLKKQLLSNQTLAFFHSLIARIYFILLKNVLKQTWIFFTTKLRPLRKDWNSSYQVIQVLALFLSLIAVGRNKLKKNFRFFLFFFLMFYQKNLIKHQKSLKISWKYLSVKFPFDIYLFFYWEVNLVKTVIFRLEFT